MAIALQYSIFVARGDVSRSMTQHLERMPHAARRAKLFDAPLVRIFSFIRPGSTPDDHREECCAGCALAKVAEAANVILLHENEEALEPHLGE